MWVCCCPHCQHVWRGRRVVPLNLWKCGKWSVVCVSESDCQSQFSVGCRRSGKDQFVSVELFVKTPRLRHVCSREEECLPIWCFLTTFPVWRGGGSEDGDWRAEQWSVCLLPLERLCFLIGQLGCPLCDWFVTVVFPPQFYNLCQLSDWPNQLSVPGSALWLAGWVQQETLVGFKEAAGSFIFEVKDKNTSFYFLSPSFLSPS